jgi:hypothetical protein
MIRLETCRGEIVDIDVDEPVAATGDSDRALPDRESDYPGAGTTEPSRDLGST